MRRPEVRGEGREEGAVEQRRRVQERRMGRMEKDRTGLSSSGI